MEETLKGIYDVEKKAIIGKASCFVIPNSSGVCNNFIAESTRIRCAKELAKYCELNECEFDPDTTKLIQVWWHSDDYFGTDNMYRHSCSVIGTDGKRYRFKIETPEYMPLSMIVNVKEGDERVLWVPVNIYGCDHEEVDIDATMEVEMTFQQKGYRYERFGNFEDAVKYTL